MQENTSDSGMKTVFSNNLRTYMKEKNKTRKELCRELDIRYTTFCDWINGRTLPGQAQIKKLEDYFNVRTGELFVITENEPAATRQMSRLASYDKKVRTLEMRALDDLTDEQVKELLDSGFCFSHKKLEDYIDESGEALKVSGELDWGEPVGNEIW